jgi:hypothetical protein
MAEIKPRRSHDGSSLGVSSLHLPRQGVWAGLRIQTRAPATSQEHPYRWKGKFQYNFCVVNVTSRVKQEVTCRDNATVKVLHAKHSKFSKGLSSTAVAAANVNAQLSHYPHTPIYSFRCTRLPHSFLLLKHI